jgi:hypothetical protein
MVRSTVPKPLVFAMRLWRRLRRMARRQIVSPLTQGLLALGPNAVWELGVVWIS